MQLGLSIQRPVGLRRLHVCAFQGGSGGSSNVKVSVKVPLKVQFGQSVAITGSSPALGTWEEPVTLDWSEGDVWTGELEMPVGESISFKLLIKGKHGGLEWQPGADRTLDLPAEAAAVEVVADWGAPEPEVTVLEAAADVAVAAAVAELAVVREEEEKEKEEALAAAEEEKEKKQPVPPAPPAAAVQEPAVQAQAAMVTPAAASAKVESAAPALAATAPAESGYSLLEDLTTKDLKERLKILGLSLTGRKVELIDRLREALGMQPDF